MTPEPTSSDTPVPMPGYVKCSPGGNVTVLVFARVERTGQPGIARHIMAQHRDVEQVGFVEWPEEPGAVARLQIAGGEFCGNATRALAWTLLQKGWPGTASGDGRFALEVSGAGRLLHVVSDGPLVRVEMPIKPELASVKQVKDHLIVEIEGITHVLVGHPPPADAVVEADHILAALDLKPLRAAGVLFCEHKGDGISVWPVVWIRDTNTLTEETACASGSICVALAVAAAAGKSLDGFPVFQPSGSIITTSVQRRDDRFVSATIEGAVEILEEGELTVPGEMEESRSWS